VQNILRAEIKACPLFFTIFIVCAAVRFTTEFRKLTPNMCVLNFICYSNMRIKFIAWDNMLVSGDVVC